METYLECYFICKMVLWEGDVKLDVQVALLKRISIMGHTFTFNTLYVSWNTTITHIWTQVSKNLSEPTPYLMHSYAGKKWWTSVHL